MKTKNEWRKELEFATDDLCNHDDGHEDYCIYRIVVPIVEKALSRHDKERTAEVVEMVEEGITQRISPLFDPAADHRTVRIVKEDIARFLATLNEKNNQ